MYGTIHLVEKMIVTSKFKTFDTKGRTFGLCLAYRLM
jgi:hypothetical protein